MDKKSKNQNEEYIMICPKCSSSDVSIDFTNNAVWAYGTPSEYRCNNCGHVSQFFPEVPKSKVKNLERVKEIKDPEIDTTPGYTGGKIELILTSGIFGLIFLILGLILFKQKLIYGAMSSLAGLILLFLSFRFYKMKKKQ